MTGRVGTLGAALLAFAALALLGRILPHWLVLVATLAFAKGLVALGLVVLLLLVAIRLLRRRLRGDKSRTGVT